VWKFSLRELVLLTTVIALALAINVWSQRELRAQRRATELYLKQLENYAQRLRKNLDLARYQAAEHESSVQYWIAKGRLLPEPEPVEALTCGDCGFGDPDWSVLDEPTPWETGTAHLFDR
jgi:hypothetical protein